jgi:type IV pilus assembly protein PilO
MTSAVFDTQTLQFGRLLHYAGMALVLICSAAAYHWGHTPMQADIFNAQVRLDELVQSGRNADAIRREHGRLSSRLEEIEARYAALQRRVPTSAEAGAFLKDVSQIAHEEKLEISNFQPANSVEGEGYTAMEVMLDGEGSFASICSFFDRLSKIQRLSKVRRLSVKVDPLSDTYPMEATIVIYFGLKAQRPDAGQKGAGRG